MTLPSPEDDMLDAHVSGTCLRAFDGPRSDRCFLILAASYWSCCLGFVSCVRCIAWPLGFVIGSLAKSWDNAGLCGTPPHCILALGFIPSGISLGLVHYVLVTRWQAKKGTSRWTYMTLGEFAGTHLGQWFERLQLFRTSHKDDSGFELRWYPQPLGILGLTKTPSACFGRCFS